MRAYTLITVLILSANSLRAQNCVTGKIYDKETKEAIAGATVFIPRSQTGTTSAANGGFVLSSELVFDSITVRSIGYVEQTLKVNPGEFLLVALAPSPTNMQEVVVTANREATLRTHAPVAISKLPTEIINDTKPVWMAELINKIPGVVMQNYNNEQHGMSIRQPMGTAAYFLYMEDGLPIRPTGIFNHNALIETNIFSVSNIEVIKGPASSLYGPEAVGGAINFITQRPTAIPTAKLGLQTDHEGYRRIQYVAGGMITKKLGIHAGGFYSDQKNSWQAFSDFTKNSIHVRLDYQATPKTKFFTTTSYNDYYSQTGGSVDSLSFYTRQYTGTTDFTYRAIDALRSRLSLEHTWNDRNQTSLTAFFRNGTIGQNPSYAIKWKTGSMIATGEINESSFKSYGIAAQHITKFDFLHAKLISGTLFDFSPARYGSYQVDLAAQLRPDKKSVEKYTITGERPDIKLADYSADLFNSAAYAQLEVQPVKNLRIIAGARYDRMQFDYSNYLDQSAGSRLYDQLTGKMGVTYDFGKDKGMYANYSRGFSPPGLTSVFRKKPGIPAGEPPQFYYNLEPARFDNMEIGGWASLWKDKVYADAALYTMFGKNELLNVRQPDNSTDYQSAGKTTHRGVEFGLTSRPSETFLLRISGAYSLHRFDEFLLSEKQTDAFKDAGGKMMPSSPEWIANSELTFKPQKFLKGLRIGLEWQRISSWYQNQINSVKYDDRTFLGLRGISILNLRAGYQWHGMEAFMNVMNLTDELYAHSATRGNNLTDRTTFTPAAPRIVVLGIQYNFTGKK